MAARMLAPVFLTANPLYAGAAVSGFAIDDSGLITATRVAFYTGQTGVRTMVNPQTLSDVGRWPVPPYIEESTIFSISGPHVASHDTGVIEPPAFGSGKGTAEDGDATPDTSGLSYLVLANTGATSLTTFDSPVKNGRLVVEHATGNTTLVHDVAKLLLLGSIDYTPAAGAIQEFVYDGSLWREISRIT